MRLDGTKAHTPANPDPPKIPSFERNFDTFSSLKRDEEVEEGLTPSSQELDSTHPADNYHLQDDSLYLTVEEEEERKKKRNAEERDADARVDTFKSFSCDEEEEKKTFLRTFPRKAPKLDDDEWSKEVSLNEAEDLGWDVCEDGFFASEVGDEEGYFAGRKEEQDEEGWNNSFANIEEEETMDEDAMNEEKRQHEKLSFGLKSVEEEEAEFRRKKRALDVCLGGEEGVESEGVVEGEEGGEGVDSEGVMEEEEEEEVWVMEDEEGGELNSEGVVEDEEEGDGKGGEGGVDSEGVMEDEEDGEEGDGVYGEGLLDDEEEYVQEDEEGDMEEEEEEAETVEEEDEGIKDEDEEDEDEKKEGEDEDEPDSLEEDEEEDGIKRQIAEDPRTVKDQDKTESELEDAPSAASAALELHTHTSLQSSSWPADEGKFYRGCCNALSEDTQTFDSINWPTSTRERSREKLSVTLETGKEKALKSPTEACRQEKNASASEATCSPFKNPFTDYAASFGSLSKDQASRWFLGSNADTTKTEAAATDDTPQQSTNTELKWPKAEAPPLGSESMRSFLLSSFGGKESELGLQAARSDGHSSSVALSSNTLQFPSSLTLNTQVEANPFKPLSTPKDPVEKKVEKSLFTAQVYLSHYGSSENENWSPGIYSKLTIIGPEASRSKNHWLLCHQIGTGRLVLNTEVIPMASPKSMRRNTAIFIGRKINDSQGAVLAHSLKFPDRITRDNFIKTVQNILAKL